ncbi:hypothetical protein JMJ35_006804 [Cladonia borealis]|uniref:CipC-like antibiotic response protein n=1 Tax=Cladonia borealis TaxID=184061 RepID=A0AA39V010_9LECA|nr:hypothetical protein JMJ35_006804 [Cladonia borealis]
MGWGWDDARNEHQQVYEQDGGYTQPDNQAKFSHELVSGAASFEAMKLFEDHQRKEGKQVDHQFAKELLAGFAGGEIDKLAETHGMNEYDKLRAHHQAKERSKELYDQHYGNNNGYDPNYGPPQQLYYQQQNQGGY